MLKFSVTLTVLCIFTVSLCAQELTLTVSGPESVNIGDTHTYYAEFRQEGGITVTPPEGGTYQWFVDGGTILVQTDMYCQVQWTRLNGGNVQFEYYKDPYSYWDNQSVMVNQITPQAPSNLVASNLTTTSFTASWNNSWGADNYQVDISVTNDFSELVIGYDNLTTTGTSISVTGLARSKTYYCRVRAVNTLGVSPNSNPITIVLPRPNPDYNYFKSTVLLKPGVKTRVQVDGATFTERNIQYSFADGLGRPVQNVQQQASPSGLDVVQPVAYDQFGRETHVYLPFTTENNGWVKEGIIDPGTKAYVGAAESFYKIGSDNKIADDVRPYAEVIFEPSPLGRPEREYGAGHDWSVSGANKFVKHGYLINKHGTAAGQEKVVAFTIDASGMPVRMMPAAGIIESGSYYSTGRLKIKSTTDEQGNEVREYITKEGKIILKKVQAVPGATDLNNTTQWAMTYYVYDDLGNERYVFQPELSKIIHQNDTYNPTSADLNNWAFQKKYDNRGRVVEKRVPGADWVYLVYDKRDRLVLTQDGNQRNSTPKYWTFTKYDELNRPILTGIKDTAVTVTQAAMQTVVDNFYNKSWTKFYESYVGNAAGNVHGYTNKSYPVVTSAATLDVNHYINVNYYDNYNFRSLWAGNYAYADEALLQTVNGVNYTQPTAEFLRVTGQATGTKVKVLDGGVRGGYVWLKSINYYDDKYRVVQIMADNYKGGTDRVTNLLDFAGKVLQNKTTHLTQDITWKNVVNVSVVGSKLTNIAGSGWGNASAASQQVLNANTDGWIETTVPEITTARMFGLTTNDAGQGYANINYGFLIANPLQVYELGSPKYTDPVVPKPGDKLRIARVGTQVKYYKNDQLLYTSATSSSSSLTADLSFNNGGATFIAGISSFSSKQTTVLRELEYDHAGRLLKTWHTYNGGQRVLLASNEYNELGQLVDKKLHSTNGTEFKQSLDYEYNIRGWLTKMNDSDLSSTDANALKDLFGFELGYNQSIGVGNTSLYNGNISAMKWSNNLGLSDNKQKAYLYSYDAMNRLTDAGYKEATVAVPTWASVNGGAFAESGLTYDLNGNIKTLTRKGKDGTLIDNLTYDYGAGTSFHSNKLRKVTDAGNDTKGFTEFNASGDDYVYDSNGSLLWDRNKGGQELLKNGEFTTGSSDWTVTDTGSRLTFANDRVEIVSGSASSTLQQNNLLKAWSDYIVIIDMERTSGTANLTLTAGGTAVTVSNTGLSTFDMRTTSTKDFVVTIPAAFVGRINSIQVKGLMTISYNYLNLVERVSRSSDQTLNYIYDAAGRKLCQMLSKNNAPVKKTDYASEYFYENDTLKFINHEEGRIVVTGQPEHQYFLKDHLGNVRLTFTTKDSKDTFTATLEAVNQSAESAVFKNYSPANNDLFDHTDAGTVYTYAQLLHGGNNSQVGLAKSISVMPGDTIKAEVYAKYWHPTNNTGNLSAFATALTSAFGLTPPQGGDPGTAYNALNSYGTVIAGGYDHSENQAAPKAYLNILLFDRDYNFVDAAYKQIGDNDKQGDDIAIKNAHGYLSREMIATTPGYVFIFVSNENPTQVDVYFDDFNVEHIQSSVVETTDFMPFGWQFNSFAREQSVDNRIKFQGQEHIDELNLGWDSFRWRNHMPDIGRFFNIDPLADKYVYNSPYAFSENHVVAHRELEGLEKVSINEEVAEANGTSDPNAYKKVDGNKRFWKALPEAAKSATLKTLTLTDANDAAVLSTWIAPGFDAKNIDNTSANSVDKGFAVAGVFLPFISGSSLKSSFKLGGDFVMNLIGDGKRLSGEIELTKESSIIFDSKVVANGDNVTLSEIGFYQTKGEDILGAENKGNSLLPIKVLNALKESAFADGFKTLTLEYKRVEYDADGKFVKYGDVISQTINLTNKK